MSSDVSWHIRDKLWPMPKYGSIILYILRTQNKITSENMRTLIALVNTDVSYTLAWKCPRNCHTQLCHEFGQGSCGTSESKSDSCADDGPAALRNSKRDAVAVSCDCLVTTNMWSWLGGAGRVVEWFRVAKYNHNCWNSVAESYLARTRHAHQVTAEVLHIL